MKATTIIITITTLATSVHSAALGQRNGTVTDPVVTTFRTGYDWDCANASFVKEEKLSTAIGTCNSLPGGVRSIKVDTLNPKCECEFYT